MSQTPEGAIKARQTMKEKYGEDYYKLMGSAGGKVKSPLKGFGQHREMARIQGAIGGRISRRTKKA